MKWKPLYILLKRGGCLKYCYSSFVLCFFLFSGPKRCDIISIPTYSWVQGGDSDLGGCSCCPCGGSVGWRIQDMSNQTSENLDRYSKWFFGKYCPPSLPGFYFSFSFRGHFHGSNVEYHFGFTAQIKIICQWEAIPWLPSLSCEGPIL